MQVYVTVTFQANKNSTSFNNLGKFVTIKFKPNDDDNDPVPYRAHLQSVVNLQKVCIHNKT